MTETVWPAKPTIFIFWSFPEKNVQTLGLEFSTMIHSLNPVSMFPEGQEMLKEEGQSLCCVRCRQQVVG